MSLDEKKELRVHIRWMIRRDMSEIIDIETLSFEYPWSEEDFVRCLRQRNCIGMVAEHGDRVVGFMIYELHKTRLHILNFAVHPDQRFNRIGMQMVNKLVSKLSHQRRTRILLEVRERNLPAQMFFRSLGFQRYLATRKRHNHFFAARRRTGRQNLQPDDRVIRTANFVNDIVESPADDIDDFTAVTLTHAGNAVILFQRACHGCGAAESQSWRIFKLERV